MRSIRQGPRRRLSAAGRSGDSSGNPSGDPSADGAPGDAEKTPVELPPLRFPDDDWGKVLRELSETVPDQAMRTWLITTRVTSLGDTTAVITCVDPFNADWVRDKYGTDLGARLSAAQGRALHLEFVAERPGGRSR